MFKRKYNLENQKFGHWTVLKYIGAGFYWCKCSCGSERDILTHHLIVGLTKACFQCHLKNNIEILRKVNQTHRMSRTRLYNIWNCMRGRCDNVKHSAYKYYGARAIKICKRWERFESFKEDMYESYLKHIEKFGK